VFRLLSLRPRAGIAGRRAHAVVWGGHGRQGHGGLARSREGGDAVGRVTDAPSADLVTKGLTWPPVGRSSADASPRGGTTEPAGPYTFFLALTPVGALADGQIGPSDVLSAGAQTVTFDPEP
jgi:hypothetical protein